ncbi:MAG: PstS family phosphate ABC transporter substrate-binding protein [Hungatella hathewayi]|uniref:PBP domain-containing protein n=1 Tax=Hungatella hathewayi WAL-18680 TaxID=742737 RepID=G5IID8_9FIRM|nr:substrate-binding domain-containing protein [Hungatella hathewayi]EHI58750.1 hypothetical protein HMPREF9473_03266 [ [Hungatella hathewayi WAL-18680]MBS4983496.1 substrate-binding domain-containing protein [Hungatella hathewayi]
MRKRKTKALILCAALAVTTILSGCQIIAREQESPTTMTSAPTSNNAETPATEPVTEEPEKAVEEISAPKMKPEEYPAVDGSTATLPLSKALYQLVTGATAQEAEAAIEHTKTTNAYNALIYSYGADLVLAYEPAPSVYETMKEAGVNLTIKPIGKDALVFLANEGNPVRSLTGQQIQDIYSGHIHNWSEVGGAGKNIQAFQRPENSGSQTLMEKLVMKGTAMDSNVPHSMSVSEMGELIEKVASYNNQENALGYSVYFYARNMYEVPGLRFMAVDGVMPDNDTIKDGSYPYVNDFYAAIREDEPEDSAAHILFDWLTTDDGQALVESLGYVGLKDVEKALGEDLSDHTVIGDAQITFTDKERFLLDGDYAYGTDGVMVMDEKMQVIETIDGVRLPTYMELADITKPVILEEAKEGKAGLYDLQRHTWLAEPTYISLYYNENDGQLYGYGSTENGDKQLKLTVHGTNVTAEVVPDYVTGTHIWNVDHEGKTATITDKNGNVVRTIDFKEYVDYQYGYTVQNYFYATGEDNDFELFNENGESVMNPKSIENGREFVFGTIDLYGRWILGEWKDTGDSFIYDLTQKKVVTAPGDKISIYITDKDSHYVVENREGITVYQSFDKPVLADDGHHYEYVLGDGYYAYALGSKLVVEGGSPKQHYEIPMENFSYGYHLCADAFYLIGQDNVKIFKGETCLIDNERCNWWQSGNYMIFDNGAEQTLIMDSRDGSIRCELTDGSRVVRAYDKFLVTTRGSYLCVTDYQGRYALKQLSGYMTSD